MVRTCSVSRETIRKATLVRESKGAGAGFGDPLGDSGWLSRNGALFHVELRMAGPSRELGEIRSQTLDGLETHDMRLMERTIKDQPSIGAGRKHFF